jgi:hypothetical protein
LHRTQLGHDLASLAIIQHGVMNVPPTLEARTSDRAIASLRKAIEELAAERPREARAMVVNAAGGCRGAPRHDRGPDSQAAGNGEVADKKFGVTAAGTV